LVDAVSEMALKQPVVYPNQAFAQAQGIGLTSQRIRDRMVIDLVEGGLCDARVIQAMRATPRHLFVDEALASRAYEDTALPIGFGQTISQPSVVAMMTQALLNGSQPKRVLEIGTGSGYQTAILSQLVPLLWTVERIDALQQRAAEVLQQLGLSNIRYRHTESELGWISAAPFDAILSAAAPEEIPQTLIDQLVIGGRLVIPVGGSFQTQQLVVIEKTATGLKQHKLGQVLFVPLIESNK
jgi:protein-L-isoaspartate(D-aspartate) O-methyltransferase